MGMPRLKKGWIMESALACNMCTRQLKVENNILMEDALEVTKEWGFFSERDLEVHKFVLCESCYNSFIDQFKIPITIKGKKEVL